MNKQDAAMQNDTGLIQPNLEPSQELANLNHPVFSDQNPKKRLDFKNLSKGTKIAFVILGLMVVGGAIFGVVMMSLPKTVEQVAQNDTQETLSDKTKTKPSAGETISNEDEETNEEKAKSDEEDKESEESNTQAGEREEQNTTPAPEATPTPTPTLQNDTGLVDLFNRTPENYFKTVNAGVDFHLYGGGSASSDQDAVDKVKALGATEMIYANKTDYGYHVYRSYYDGAGNYASGYWLVYKSSVFDVASDAFNTSDSYFWSDSARMKNFLDTYVAIKNLNNKIYSSELTGNSSEYTYTYQYFVVDGNSLKLYRAQIFINRQTGKFRHSGAELQKEATI